VPTVPEVPETGTPASTAPLPDEGFFAKGSPGYYAAWYGPEWAFVGVVAVYQLGKLTDYMPVMPALMGPVFDANNPDPAVLDDPRLDGVIGKPFVAAKVGTTEVIGATIGATVLGAVVDGFVSRDFHHTHSMFLGGATALTGASAVTEVFKLGVGRLRPDFRDRYQRASCSGSAPANDALDCDTILADGFTIDAHDYAEGFKSFPSGHASSTFSTATYLSMWIGSEWVWGERATELSSVFGSFAMGGLYSGAAFVAASRFSDNKHHLEDILTGAALGAGVGAGIYLLHFDLDGNARWRGISVGPGPGAGLSLSGRF
jgi:membrane-associated phospholipid phosphatase